MSSAPKERELFGTLLASTPQRTRSWRALFIAVAIHAALIALAIVTFKPFQPRGAEEELLPINMIVVEEDEVAPLPNPFARATSPVAVAGAPRQPEEQLVFTPGPLAPIVIEPGPATPVTTDERPSVNGRAGVRLSDRLRPTYVDPRIGNTTAFPPAEKTGAEAVRVRIADQLAAWNDSIAADKEAARRDADWTIMGKDGSRWGVSSEGVHLGKITIPANAIAFKPPAGRREEIAGRARDFAEIERQAMLEESRSSFKERVQSIRARKDREREEKRKKTEEKPITDAR